MAANIPEKYEGITKRISSKQIDKAVADVLKNAGVEVAEKIEVADSKLKITVKNEIIEVDLSKL